MAPRIAIIGAGLGGITAALALRKAGLDVSIHEQAPVLRAIGAAITMTPNAMKVIGGLVEGDAIRRLGYRPPWRLNRTWDTGAITSEVELGPAAEAKFGAPLLMFHRAELLAALAAAIPPESIHLGRKLVSVENLADGVRVRFSDDSEVTAEAVIGADGIHSTVRELLFGPQAPHFTGAVGYRSLVPIERLSDMDISPFTKWWGPTRESEVVTCPTSGGREFYVFASIAQDAWREEAWSTPGDVREVREAFSNFAPELQRVLAACDETLKSALCERNPLPVWTQGRITLLGDACHPMTPFMAQGAAMAIEDSAILSRCLAGLSAADLPRALQNYENSRRERTSKMQVSSHNNQWHANPVDANWVYGFDAWTAKLAA